MKTTRILAFTLLLLLCSCLFFMLFNANGNWDFVIPFRGKKLLLLLTVAYTIGVSTLLFQTLTHNPILTPSILGFDSLYLLTQTLLVYFLGGIGFTLLDISFKFAIETGLMLIGALLLFRTLTKENSDLTRMLLIGVVFGVLFRSLNNLLQRMIDPEEFAVAQSSSFASFNTANPTLLFIGITIALLSMFWIWQQRHKLDVLLLVSVSTALVGPILFLGLLVCAIVNAVSPTVSHAVRIPLTFLISGITLVLGQTLFEQIFKLQGVLSVVIELLGGLVFIYLMLKKQK